MVRVRYDMRAAPRATAGPIEWHTAVGYSLYLRSFADSNGDGIGDLRGVIEHLDHLCDLGVDIVWISPFYPSPLVDGGYDITDHCAVDPRFGSLEDVDELIAAAHERGQAVLFDLVANHTSCEHPWFRAARSGRDDPHHNRYIWADPSPDGGPPNNWVSYFGGSAWTYDADVGQYYLHLFLPEQPDLNWRDPGVREEYDRILRFWLDRGVDGFRVDVAQGLSKDRWLRSNPERWSLVAGSDRIAQWAAFEHRHDVLQPENLEIFRHWRRLCAAQGAVLVGEVSVGDADLFVSMLADDGLDVGMWLEPMHVDWDAASLRAVLQAPIERLDGSGVIGWQASSLDEPRAVTRFGGGEVGRRRAMALTTLLAFLPGMPFLYQGDELGLEQGVVGETRRIDPVGTDAASSRDGCRTPMPWNTGPMSGFTSGQTTWLPFADDSARGSVEAQRRDPSSTLCRHRALMALRRSTTIDPKDPIEWIDFGEPSLIGYRRGDLVVVVNTADGGVSLPLSSLGAGDAAPVVVFDSLGGGGGGGSSWRGRSTGADITLEGAHAIVVRT